MKTHLHILAGTAAAALLGAALPSAFADSAVVETQTVTPAAPVVTPPVVEERTTTTTTAPAPTKHQIHEQKEHEKKELKKEYKAEKEAIEHPDRAEK